MLHQSEDLGQLGRSIKEAAEGYLQVGGDQEKMKFVGAQQIRMRFPK